MDQDASTLTPVFLARPEWSRDGRHYSLLRSVIQKDDSDASTISDLSVVSFIFLMIHVKAGSVNLQTGFCFIQFF